MLDARFSHLYFCQSLNRLQRGLSGIAELVSKHRGVPLGRYPSNFAWRSADG